MNRASDRMAGKELPMELKLDADGHVVVQDGKTVYKHPDGKEVPFDATATVATDQIEV